MHDHVHWLFTEVDNPFRSKFLSLIIFSKIFFLLVDVVIGKCLKALVAVAFKFEI